jgi:hypothetical protein
VPLRVRIASLNLRATPNRRPQRLVPLFELLALASPDLVLLLECRAGWLDLLCARNGLSGVRSNDSLLTFSGCRMMESRSRSNRR